MTRALSLVVNDFPIKLDYFVQAFIDHTVGGMLEALEGTGKIQDLVLTIDGEEVTINLNGADIPINAFVNKIIGSTTKGMVSTLKGVNEINTLKLEIRR